MLVIYILAKDILLFTLYKLRRSGRPCMEEDEYKKACVELMHQSTLIR